jgi:hypothetical protein
MKDTDAMLKLQKNEDDDSDDDELNGWGFSNFNFCDFKLFFSTPICPKFR